jgi:O-antigen/teichoic acid export membrane protein
VDEAVTAKVPLASAQPTPLAGSPPRLMRAGVQTYAYSALTLVANLVSGIVSARALGPSGRGVTAALVALTQLAGFLFAMGASQSLSYFIAKTPQDGPRLFTTWLLLLLPATLVAVVAGELLLSSVFSIHNPVAITAGRWFLITIVLVVGVELNNGLLLGMHDYLLYNVLRFAQPAMMAASFVVLWQLGSLTVTSALIAPSVATAIVLVVGMARSLRRIGLGAVDLALGGRTLWYGFRGQGVLLATHVNARLDVTILPAYVVASSVGLYAVATNVSLIIYQLSGTFAAVLVPAAARDPARGPGRIRDSLYGSVAVAAILALGLGLLAEPLLGLVYGSSFRPAAGALRLLLPGAVLFAGSSILSAGVYAAGRPFIASVAQLLGLLVTVVGLLVFLPIGGITAAALVSTASYSTVFAAALIAFKVVTGMPWGWFLSIPAWRGAARE